MRVGRPKKSASEMLVEVPCKVPPVIQDSRPLRRDSLCPYRAALVSTMRRPLQFTSKGHSQNNYSNSHLPLDSKSHLNIITSFPNGMTGRSELRGQLRKRR